MLKSEKDFVEHFIQSVAKQKGHAFKVSMSTIGGLPDLICIMPGYAPVLLEAKLIRDVKGVFKRAIPYSGLQTNLMNNCNVVNTKYRVAFGLIFVTGYHCAVKLMNPDVPTITSKELEDSLGLDWIVGDKPIDVLHMFAGVVPTIGYPIVEDTIEDMRHPKSYITQYAQD